MVAPHGRWGPLGRSRLGPDHNQTGSSGLAKLDAEQGWVCAEQRPAFRFGNSSRNQCLSTAWMKIQAEGRTTQRAEYPHSGSGHFLGSFLIDFESDFVSTFRHPNKERIIQLEQSS